jgi:hypothetical protein
VGRKKGNSANSEIVDYIDAKTENNKLLGSEEATLSLLEHYPQITNHSAMRSI